MPRHETEPIIHGINWRWSASDDVCVRPTLGTILRNPHNVANAHHINIAETNQFYRLRLKG